MISYNTCKQYVVLWHQQWQLHQRLSHMAAAIRGHNHRLIHQLTSNTADQRRIAVYQNNYQTGVIGHLQNIYPACVALIDGGSFTTLAAEFMRKYPPQTGNINHYGQKLPDFLRRHPMARKLPVLAELARFEWAQHALLQGIGSDYQVLSANWPVDQIYQACLRQDDLPVDPQPIKLCLWRDQHMVFWRRVV